MAESILAIDPGVETGFCLFNNGNFHQYQIDAHHYANPHSIIYDHLSNVRPDRIVYEAFHFRQGQTGVVLSGVEFIGVIELWTQHNRVAKEKFNPNKKFWDDTKFRTLGIYKPSLGHAMDATRVMCAWLQKNDQAWYTGALEILRKSAQR